MKPMRLSLLLVLASILVVACEEPSQSANKPPSNAAAIETTTESAATEEVAIDETRYIRAADLLVRIENKTRHFVFDVRSKKSYAESHVRNALSMPYGKVEAEDVAALEQMTMDTPVVTYCGCPHHLAGLAADQLIEWGYTNVRVLYEGFWYWKDNRFPVAGLQRQQTHELKLAGIILSGKQPVADTNVFILNTRNGQLEAAATNAQGRFETGFHVLDYHSEDRFEVRIGSLDAPVSHLFSTDIAKTREDPQVLHIELES